jgi:hypothetical protein
VPCARAQSPPAAHREYAEIAAISLIPTLCTGRQAVQSILRLYQPGAAPQAQLDENPTSVRQLPGEQPCAKRAIARRTRLTAPHVRYGPCAAARTSALAATAPPPRGRPNPLRPTSPSSPLSPLPLRISFDPHRHPLRHHPCHRPHRDPRRRPLRHRPRPNPHRRPRLATPHSVMRRTAPQVIAPRCFSTPYPWAGAHRKPYCLCCVCGCVCCTPHVLTVLW